MGKIIRLKGMGIPRFRKTDNGDQYLRVKVIVPEKLTKNQRDHWGKIKKIENEKPGFLDGVFLAKLFFFLKLSLLHYLELSKYPVLQRVQFQELIYLDFSS